MASANGPPAAPERPHLKLALALSAPEAPPRTLAQIDAEFEAESLARSTHLEGRKGPDLAEIAYKVSYAGTLLLTADRIWRSVDSLMDSIKIETDDGCRLRLTAEPASRGFEVMLRVNRSFDF